MAQIDAFPGRVLVSRETLSRARPPEVARAVSSLAPTAVRVVVTARDPARQVRSVWQQQVKQQHVGSLADFTSAVVRRAPGGDDFWALQDLLAVVDRWLAAVPAGDLTVVTVPRSGAGADLLWTRFAAACGFEPTGFDLDVQTPNESLGVAQVELLRRINGALAVRPALSPSAYRALARRLLANELLATQPAFEPFGIDEATHTWAVGQGRAWADGLRARGICVVGALDELVPGPFVPATNPTDVSAEAMVASAGELLADLLVQWERRGFPLPQANASQVRDAGARRRPGSGG